jgi:hypothetical protein
MIYKSRFLAPIILFMVCFSSSMTLVSCKSKAAIIEIKKDSLVVKSNKVIENYYNNKNEFSTLYIKSNVHYFDGKQTQNVTAEIKIQKDEQISISIRFLGITMAKALITPTKVSYYEKINGSYFEGDFSILSQKLGTDLNFIKLQNLILGQTIEDLKIGNYTESLVGQTYKLEDVLVTNFKKAFYLDADKFFLKKQEIVQIAEGRMIEVNYANQLFYKEAILPSKINITASQNEKKTELNLDYTTITFNEALSFPYSVPDGYNRIIIK